MLSSEKQQKPCLRKTWKFSNGSCSSVFRLRYHLAEEGCQESQVSLARSLLVGAEQDPAAAELAVHWLLKAADQSSAEALALLQQCYEHSCGITTRNRHKVQDCLSRTETEKRARCISRRIFDEVTADGSIDLNLGVFRKRIEECTSRANTLTPDVAKGPRVDFSNVFQSVHNVLKAKAPELRVCESSALGHRWYALPWTLLSSGAQKGATYLTCESFLFSMISTLILILVIGKVMCPSCWMKTHWFLPTVIRYSSSVCIVLSCATMFKLNCDVQNTESWITILKHFDSKIKNEVKHNVQHKVIFWMCLFLVNCALFLTFSPARIEYVKDMDIFIFMLFYLFVYYNNFFTALPKKARWAQTSQLVLCCFIKSDIPNLFLTPSLEPYVIYAKALFILIITFFLIYLLLKYDALQFLNNCVLVISLCFVLTLKETHTLEKMATNVVCLLCVILLTNICNPFSSCSFVLIVHHLFSSHSLKEPMINILVFAVCIVFGWLYRKVSMSRVLRKWKFIITFAMILLSISYLNKEFSETSVNAVDWNRYKSLCYQPALEESNFSFMKEQCSALHGSKITTEGTLVSVTTASKINYLELILSAVPAPVNLWLTQIFGDKKLPCHKSIMTELELSRCIYFESLYLPLYNLDSWSSYRFEIVLQLSNYIGPTMEVIAEADESCKEFAFKLQTGDWIEVDGLLVEAGVPKPKIKILRATSSQYNICKISENGFAMDWKKLVYSLISLISFFTL